MADEELGSAELELTTDDSKFKSGLKGAEGTLRSFASIAGSISDGITKAISGTAKAFSTIGLAAQGIKATAGAITGIGESIVKGNAQFEDYNVQFKTLIKNSDDFKAKYAGITDEATLNAKATEEATQKMKDLAAFGASTPFDLPGVVEANKTLTGFGLQADNTSKRFGYNADQIMTITGDLASGTGQSFQDMATNIGKFSAGATGEAISRFQELGVVTRDQLTKMGLQFDKSGSLIVKNQEDMDKATSILFTAIKNKYGGLMDEQSSTFNGMMSNLQDWISGVGRILAAPIFEPIKKGLTALMKVLGSTPFDENVKGITKFGLAVLKLRDIIQKSVDTIVKGFKEARQGIGFFLDGIDGDFSGIIATGGKVNTFMYNLGVTFRLARDSVLTFISAVQGKWIDSDQIQDVNRIFGNLGTTIYEIVTVVKQLWDAFAQSDLLPIVEDALKLYQAISPLSIVFDTLMGFMRDGVPGAINALEQHFQGLTGSFNNLIGDIGKAITDLAGPVLQWIGQQIPVLLNALAGWGQAFIDWIGPQIPGMLSALGDIASNIWDWVTSSGKTLVENLANWGKAFIEWIGPMIPPFLAELGKLAAGALEWIGNQVGPFVEQLAQWGKAFIDWVMPQLPGIIDEIGKIGAGVLKWIGDKAPDILAKLAEWGVSFVGWVATDVLPKIPGLIGDIVNMLFTWISAFAGGLGPKLGEWGQKFLDWAGEVVPKIPAALGSIIGSIWDWISAQAGGFLPKFENEWGPAFWKWIGETAPKVNDELGKWVDGLSDGLTKAGIYIHDNIGTWTVGTMTAIGEWTVAAKNAIVDGVHDMAKWFIDTAVSMWDDWRHNWEQNGGKLVDGLIKGIEDAWNGLIDSVGRAIQTFIDKVKGFFGIHSPSTVFSDIGDAIVQGLIQGLTNAWHGVTELWDGFMDGLKKAWDGFTGWFSGEGKDKFKHGVEEISSGGASWATEMDGHVTDVATSFAGLATKIGTSVAGFKTNVDKMPDATKNAVNQVKDALTNNPAEAAARNLGLMIAIGLAGGIMAKAADAANAARNMVQGAINAAKQTAQSASPSKVMIQEGKNLTDGVKVGIEQNKQGPVQALVDVFAGMNQKALEAAAASGELVSKITSSVGDVISAMTSLRGYVGPGADAMKAFTGDMVGFVNMYVAASTQVNAKALEGSAKFTASAQAIAGAVSALVGSISMLKKWSSPGLEAMTVFVGDTIEIMKQFIGAANNFNSQGIAAAQLFSDTVTKVAPAISAMAEALPKLLNWVGLARDSISGFAGNVKDIVMDFATQADFFKEGMMDAAMKFASTASVVANTVSGGADALKKLLDWVGIARDSLSGFAGNLKDIVMDFMTQNTFFTEDMYKGAATFANGANAVVDVIGKAADGLSKLLDWVGLARESISGFVGNLKDVIVDFSEAAKIFDKDMYERAQAFAETAGKVVDVIGKAASGLADLLKYKTVAGAIITQFVTDVRAVVGEFVTQSAGLTPDMLTAATAFAEAASKVVSVIGGAVTAFQAVNKYKGVIGTALTQLITDTVTTVKNFSLQVAGIDPDATAAGAAFSEAAGKIFDGLNKAITLFQGLASYVGIPSKILDAFINDVKLTVQKATDMAILTNSDLVAQISAFGDAIGKLFDGLKAAMELFASLKDFQSTPSKVIDAFIGEIRYTIQLASTLANDAQTDLNEKAQLFATAVGDIFTKLKTAIDTFTTIGALKDDPTNAVKKIIDGLASTITYMATLNTKAQSIYDAAVAYAQKMNDAAQKIAEGNAAIGGDVGTVDPSAFNPGSGNSTSFASGGKVPYPGMFKVGELGSEYVFLPKAAEVLDAMRSRSLDRVLAGNTSTTNNNVNNTPVTQYNLNVNSTEDSQQLLGQYTILKAMAI